MALDPMAAMRPPGLEDFDISGHGGAAAAGHAVAREFGVRTDVADVIEAQMCRLIEQARQETEIKALARGGIAGSLARSGGWTWCGRPDLVVQSYPWRVFTFVHPPPPGNLNF